MESLLEPLFREWRIKMVQKHIRDQSIVADIGCGFDVLLLRRVSGRIKKGFGLDPRVKLPSEKNIEIKNGIFEKKLPFKDNELDHITALAVLEHLDYPEEMMKDAKRCLKKGGTLIVTTPAPHAHNILDLFGKIGFVSRELFEEHKTYLSAKDLKKILEEIGYSKVTVYPFELGYNTCAVAEK